MRLYINNEVSEIVSVEECENGSLMIFKADGKKCITAGKVDYFDRKDIRNDLLEKGYYEKNIRCRSWY